MRSHLILGAGGFLGRHLARAIVGSGDRADGFDIAVPPLLKIAGVPFQTGDLFQMSEDALRALVSPYDVIHHLAWSTIPATAAANPEADLGQNVALMVRLLSALRSTEKTLVFCSSGGTVYGDSKAWAVTEKTPLQPIGCYGAGKVAAETYGHVYRKAHGLDIRVARISNPFGAGQSRTRPQGALSHFIFNALAGDEISIWGDGTNVRDYIHVNDVADGLLSLAVADRDRIADCPAINIGSGNGISLNEIVALLEQMMGTPLRVRRSPQRTFDVARSVLDIGAAKRHLDWQPRIDLRSGIARMMHDLDRDPDTLLSTADSLPKRPWPAGVQSLVSPDALEN